MALHIFRKKPTPYTGYEKRVSQRRRTQTEPNTLRGSLTSPEGKQVGTFTTKVYARKGVSMSKFKPNEREGFGRRKNPHKY